MPVDHEEIIQAMERYGGSFAKALAAAWRVADDNNRNRLALAFADVWEVYRAIAERRKEDAHREP